MSKEKQIEEMAAILLETSRQDSNGRNNSKDYTAFDADTIFKYGCDRLNGATALYNAGYRKQSESTMSQVKQGEWISVDERLPDKRQEVLAYRGDFNGDMMNVYTYLGSANWEDDYGYRGSTEHEGITHWMPLPEPPKMKGGAE